MQKRLCIMPARKTKEPFLIGMVGVVGSGKTWVSEQLSRATGAAVIRSDAIRLALRRYNQNEQHIQQMRDALVRYVLDNGGSVIVDGDCVQAERRQSLQRTARAYHARVLFIRVHADIQTMLARIIASTYGTRLTDVFGGERISHVKGSNDVYGAATKIKAFWRRAPLHYRWLGGGGKWELRKLSFRIFADIDTTDTTEAEKQIREIARKVLAV